MERIVSGPKTALVKIERTKTEIRDDVAVRIYVERIMEEYATHGEAPDTDKLREIAQDALTAGFIFFQERYEDKRIGEYMEEFNSARR
jgi:hypothetical protein